MKISNVELEPLPSKHYETTIIVTFDVGQYRKNRIKFCVNICGDGTSPSQRELDRGWEPDYGVDHVESEEHLFLAQKIIDALQREIQDKHNE